MKSHDEVVKALMTRTGVMAEVERIEREEVSFSMRYSKLGRRRA